MHTSGFPSHVLRRLEVVRWGLLRCEGNSGCGSADRSPLDRSSALRSHSPDGFLGGIKSENRHRSPGTVGSALDSHELSSVSAPDTSREPKPPVYFKIFGAGSMGSSGPSGHGSRASYFPYFQLTAASKSRDLDFVGSRLVSHFRPRFEIQNKPDSCV